MSTRRLMLATMVMAFLSPLFAEMEFRGEVRTGVVWGQADEFVLRDGTLNSPVSRLVWDIAPASYAELGGHWTWNDLTSTHVRVGGALPWFPGTMVDEDWNTGSYRYARSEHQAYLASYWIAAVEQSFLWGPISFDLGAQYRWTSWEGWNGTGSYTSTSGTTNNYNFAGLIIAYRQQWIIPYLGAAISLPTQVGDFELAARYGPYVWCNDMDNHNYAGSATKTFLDYVQGGQYVQASLEWAWSADPRFQWGFRLEGAFSSGAIGETYITQTQQTTGVPTGYTSRPEAASAGFRELSLVAFVRN